ncbi:hypothetical protein AB0C40_33740 [Streptomyces brevispora]|uniref:hypothetical protein n=1 Tax=Streptomyces brevispora TaxID=887462 RepID=UPI0033F692CA
MVDADSLVEAAQERAAPATRASFRHWNSGDDMARKLGISHWRNLSKDKVLKFAAAMPEMATEARLELIEQFPAFKDLGKADIDAVAEVHSRSQREQ